MKMFFFYSKKQRCQFRVIFLHCNLQLLKRESSECMYVCMYVCM
jgi:hypothetical protein